MRGHAGITPVLPPLFGSSPHRSGKPGSASRGLIASSISRTISTGSAISVASRTAEEWPNESLAEDLDRVVKNVAAQVSIVAMGGAYVQPTLSVT